ncbi:MAG: histidine phosphatase family protein [Alphaproteobacteria bacterium]|nr:histidine phosphatase family protein [Alphaproteobacteria bacterium]
MAIFQARQSAALVMPQPAHYDDAMRRLLILRHAKTERSNPGGDHARRLLDRGREDAVRMGQYLASQNLAPAAALLSDATRTRETFELLAGMLPHAVRTRFERALYLADPVTVMEHVAQASDEAAAVLVVGHNPGLHELAFDLAQDGRPGDIDMLARKFPTSALAVVDFACSAWRDAPHASSRLERYVTAKILRQSDGESPTTAGEDDAD